MAEKKTSIGGQALIEGIMMRGPKKSAMAVRNPQGEMQLEIFDTKGSNRPKICRLPFIRGIFNMYDSLTFGYKCLMRSAEIAGVDAEEEAKKAEKIRIKQEKARAKGKEYKPSNIGDKLFNAVLMPLATVLAVVLAFGLFLYLPMKLWELLVHFVPTAAESSIWRAVFEGVIRIVIFIGYVWLTSLMKDIRRTYMFHGGEHKTIFCYEAGLPLTVENVRKQKRFHPRCGTSFIILVLLVSIIVSMFIPRTLSTPVRMLVKLALLPVIIGIGYELIKLAGRKENWLTHLISVPGVALQHLTVFEPDDSMIECAIAAMKAVIPEDGSDKW